MKMSKYGSIEQFRNIVKAVKDSTYYNGKDEEGNVLFDYTRKLPTITFTGFVKLHGTNAGIGFDGENYWAQARERIISLTEDNAGFYVYAKKQESHIKELLRQIKEETGYDEVLVYGEWCGAGIQKGVGISQLEKRLVVFDVCGVNIDENGESSKVYLDQFIDRFESPDHDLYNKKMFKTFSIDIDFANPELAVNKLVEMTISVEDECPVAKYFGIDNGLGEGIVFETHVNGTKLRFKSKGEKHSVSKVKTIVQVNPEVVESIVAFVEYAATENRLEQGLTYMKENNIEIKVENLSHYIKWVSSDIIKEESDVLVANNLTYKQVGGKIATKAREHLFEYVNKNL